jgi:hypothetical protein
VPAAAYMSHGQVVAAAEVFGKVILKIALIASKAFQWITTPEYFIKNLPLSTKIFR